MTFRHILCKDMAAPGVGKRVKEGDGALERFASRGEVEKGEELVCPSFTPGVLLSCSVGRREARNEDFSVTPEQLFAASAARDDADEARFLFTSQIVEIQNRLENSRVTAEGENLAWLRSELLNRHPRVPIAF